MILRMIIMMLACLPMTGVVQAGLWDSITGYFSGGSLPAPPTIKVLIAHDEPSAVLEVKGKYKIFDPRTGEHISTRFVGKRKNIEAVHEGLKWGEEFPGIHQLLIVPDEASTVTFVDGKEYQGTLAIYNVGGSISIVNETFVEDFLSSSLNSLYHSSMSEEAMAAIAIAARTTAYYQISNPRSQYWSVDGRQYGYEGYNPDSPLSGMDRVLKGTRYMIMGRNFGGGQALSPFVAEWKNAKQAKSGAAAGTSLLTVADTETMAQKGDHAAQILAKAFPGSVIEYMRYAY
jgi:stage II sporulation protein D